MLQLRFDMTWEMREDLSKNHLVLCVFLQTKMQTKTVPMFWLCLKCLTITKKNYTDLGPDLQRCQVMRTVSRCVGIDLQKRIACHPVQSKQKKKTICNWEFLYVLFVFNSCIEFIAAQRLPEEKNSERV